MSVPVPEPGAVLATLSGYELAVVVLALGALAVMAGSAVWGILVRFRRGVVGGRRSPASRRRGGTSPKEP